MSFKAWNDEIRGRRTRVNIYTHTHTYTRSLSLSLSPLTPSPPSFLSFTLSFSLCSYTCTIFFLSLLYLQYTYFLYDILLKYKKDQSSRVKKSKVRVCGGGGAYDSLAWKSDWKTYMVGKSWERERERDASSRHKDVEFFTISKPYANSSQVTQMKISLSFYLIHIWSRIKCIRYICRRTILSLCRASIFDKRNQKKKKSNKCSGRIEEITRRPPLYHTIQV